MSAQYPPNDPQLEEMADRVQALVDLMVAARVRAEAADRTSDGASAQGGALSDAADTRQH